MAKDHTHWLIYLLENLGFIVLPGETVAVPTQDIEFLGMIICRFANDGVASARAENKHSQVRCCEHQRLLSITHIWQGIPHTQEAKCSVPGSSTRPSVLHSYTKRFSKSSGEWQSVLQRSLPSVTGSQGTVNLVDTPVNKLEWEKFGSQATRNSDRVRCLTKRVWGILPGDTNKRSLVPRREEIPHQLPGTASMQQH